MTIKISDRLELRHFHINQAKELFQLIQNNRAYLRQWMPWVDLNRSVENTTTFIQVSLKDYVERQIVTYGIWHDEILVGVIGQHNVDYFHKKANIGYWLDQRHQGQGIVTQACQALIKHCFLAQKLHRVEIHVAVGNVKSQKIPQRLGFQKEGILRQTQWLYDVYLDHIVYGLLAYEWKQLQNVN